MNIYYHFWRDHDSSGFQKLAVNKWFVENFVITSWLSQI